MTKSRPPQDLFVARDSETRTFTITGKNAQGQTVRQQTVLVYSR
jgi:hypothetical protein